MINLGADARLAMLEILLSGDFAIKLFTNDYEPQDQETADDYVELTGHGYADAGLEPDAWVISAEADEPALAVHPKVSWTFKAGPPVAIFGYFVVWTDTQRLAWSERFVREQWIEFEGDNISVVPTFRLRALEQPMLPAIQDGVGA